MKKLLVGLTLLASMSSFGNSINEIKGNLNQEICGNNFPSISKAFEIPESLGLQSSVNMTRFQQSTQLALKAIGDIHQIEIDALFKEKNMERARLAKESGDKINFHVETMLREVGAEYRYKGLESLCSYLNY